MNKRWIRSLAMAWLAAVSWHCPESEAARFALVIGNDAYQHVTPLGNATADAQAFGEALRSGEMGFTEVVIAVNRTRSEMQALIRDFSEKVSGGDDAVVYFAGHGLQVSGTNFLLPVDVHNGNLKQIRDEAIQLQSIMDDLQERRPRFTLMVIDACRDNPFKSRDRAVGTRGLAATNPAKGQMIVYSAGDNETALDRLSDADTSPHGLFTRVWLREMRRPGMPVHEMARVVREEVDRLARSVGHSQVPALYDQSIGRFFFVAGGTPGGQADSGEAAPIAPASPPVVAPVPGTEPAPSAVNSPRPEAPPRIGRTFRDCESCPEMVVVPGGTFEMGSRDGEGDEDEHPRHAVRVRTFALGKFEVTQGQWRSFMKTHPSGYRRCGDDCPVERISWEDAQAFVASLNRKVSGTDVSPYRLATEAEWEYACRAGTGDRYCGGDTPEPLAWYAANSGDTPHRVGEKAANGFGLFDMSGNVPEWVEDCWTDDYRHAAVDGAAKPNGTCLRRVARGGGCFNQSAQIRATDRAGDTPNRRDLFWGFRVARTLR